MTWNYRLIGYDWDPEEPVVRMQECYYAEDGSINGVLQYGSVVESNSGVEGIRWTLTKMLEACDKEVISYQDPRLFGLRAVTEKEAVISTMLERLQAETAAELISEEAVATARKMVPLKVDITTADLWTYLTRLTEKMLRYKYQRDALATEIRKTRASLVDVLDDLNQEGNIIAADEWVGILGTLEFLIEDLGVQLQIPFLDMSKGEHGISRRTVPPPGEGDQGDASRPPDEGPPEPGRDR
jgi:hypothetical protein